MDHPLITISISTLLFIYDYIYVRPYIHNIHSCLCSYGFVNLPLQCLFMTDSSADTVMVFSFFFLSVRFF